MASWLEKLLNQAAGDIDDDEDGEGSSSGFELSRNLRIILASAITIISAFVIWWIMS